MLLTNLALGTLLMNQSRRAMKTLIDERMLDVVNTAAAMLDGDVLERLWAEDKDTPEYQETLNTLITFRDNINLAYIYYVRSDSDKEFSFGIDSDPIAPGEFGSPVGYTDALYAASKGTPSVDNVPYEDRWGQFYSAYSPVFDSTGKVAAVVTVDFEAAWYEHQLNQNAQTIVLACLLFLIIGIILVLILTREYGSLIERIDKSLTELENDMAALTGQTTGGTRESIRDESRSDSILHMEERISALRDELHEHISHANTQANAMITAMASDYRCVYYVNLDENDGVCYRADPNDHEQTPEGIHFPFLERFTWYGEHTVSESYREEFLNFIQPDHIREALSEKQLIAIRYLVIRNGREYYEMMRMAGVRRLEDRDDHIVHAIGVGFTEIDAEIRETMAKNEALAEALAVAEEASLAKTSFLSNMSHEIRTPMNATIGLNNLALHDASLSPQTREYMEKISGSATHLLGLINNILDMSRIEAGRLVLNKEEFSFSAMLEQINTMIMSQCATKGLHYECRILSRVDEYYIGDDTKLKEVLINILSNAIKFTPPSGSVTFTVERTAVYEDQSTLKFCIKDTGIGMDKEFIPKIFDAFSQEDSSRKSRFGATGLGMAITKSIVEMMNGTIAVESEKGKGTLFTVIITLKNCERSGPQTENYVDHNRIRVLVIDDEEIAAEHARMVLDETGIHADICLDGKDAMQMVKTQIAKQEPYNLILVDRNMPEKNGLEVTKEMRDEFPHETIIILLTAYQWDDIREEAMNAGVDGFLAKPLFASNVIAEFERIARRSNMSLFQEKKRAPLAGCHVLLAEDIELNAEIMMDVLEMEEVETDHAENGRIAVELFRDNAPGTYDAILMDIRMPEMDGLEAAEAIRAMDRPDAGIIPIIALTANAFDEDVQRSLQVGMNAHLTKPVEPDHLYQTLGELIYESREAGKER
ncbi:MAG: response regulator [Solobacterium sp.]|nr:response regulator [Solobacterium sp.]